MSGASDTPRTDAEVFVEHWGAGHVRVEFARQLERDAYQFRMDALHDSKRLIDDKMKLRADLAEALAALSAMEKKAAALWTLLDDIDTASDMFKDNYRGLAGYVYGKQRRRFEIMTGEQYDKIIGPQDSPTMHRNG